MKQTGPAPGVPAPFDQARLEALYTRLERPVYNVVYRWVWSEEDAAEIVQEAFVRLWMMRDRVRLETAKPLVYRIALNLARKRRRWRRLRTFVGLDEQTTPAHAEAALLSAERAATARQAVESLPEELRSVMLLCHYSGLSYREIGEALSIPEGTVASRRNTALKRIQASLEEAHEPHG